MTKKQAMIMRRLLCGNHVLMALSSEYSENDEKEFKENYSATFKQAERALEELRKTLDEVKE